MFLRSVAPGIDNLRHARGVVFARPFLCFTICRIRLYAAAAAPQLLSRTTERLSLMGASVQRHLCQTGFLTHCLLL